MVEFRMKILVPALGIHVALKLALIEMYVPPLTGVALKFETFAVVAMHLGPETELEYTGPVAVKLTRTATTTCRIIPFSLFNILTSSVFWSIVTSMRV